MTMDQRDDDKNLDEKNIEKKIIIETGKRCKMSGEWETEGPISTTVYVSKGELMPSYCEKKVKWILVKKG